jgi:DNA-binding PadR family transcriptional regulator
MLHTLEDNGLIEGMWETKGRQRIKYYLITDKGRDELVRVKKIFKYYLHDDLTDFMKYFWNN